MKKTDEPIVVEQTFNASVETVWDAITDVDQMRRWFFDNIPAFEAEVGFETQFNVQGQNRDFPHVWTVTGVVPQKMITCNWRFEGYEGDSVVMFEIFKHENKTKLRLTHKVLESFPENIPEFSRKSGTEGWTYFIKKSLKDYLETG